ncbi:MAG: hypothetical protein ACP5RD_03895 [bacterium]|jgi:hypothetical protein
MLFFDIDEKLLKEEADKTKQQINFIYKRLKMLTFIIINFLFLIVYIYLISYNYYLSKKYSELMNELQEINLNYKIFSSKLTTYYSKDYIQTAVLPYKSKINSLVKDSIYIPSVFIFLYNKDKILVVK